MTAFLDILKSVQKSTDDRTPFVQALAQLPKALPKYIGMWPETSRDNTIIRCSGAYDLCPRQFVLDYWNPKGSRTFPFQNQMLAGIGTHLHHYLQNVILGPLGILKGTWKLVGSCGGVVAGYYPGSHDFHKQYLETGQLEYEYVENKVWEPHYRFSGHQDGVVDKARIVKFVELINLKVPFDSIRRELNKVKHTEECCLEIKSTSTRNFENISENSLPDYYKMQANLYQELSGLHETLFWYLDRDTCSSKMFVYGFEQGYYDDACRKANTVWRALRDETLPESGMKCLTSTDARAKICPHAQDCWATRLDFKEWVQKQKERQPNRAWLDMSNYNKEVVT